MTGAERDLATNPALPPGILTSPEAQALDAALWRFMLALYARPGVQAACLELQSRCGADIVLLLAWLFCQHTGTAPEPDAARRPLGAAEVAALQAHVAEWRSRTVLPLRRLRIDLREGGPGLPDQAREALRRRVKALELQAERVQAAMIADWLCAHPAASGAEVASEAALTLLTGPPEKVRAALALLRRAAESL